MVKQVKSVIVANTELMTGVHQMEIVAPEIAELAKPGQFIMVQCGEEFVLRRPLSVHLLKKPDTLSILFKAVGKGTAWLANREKGVRLDVLVPLGNGFAINPASDSLLLIAGGIGIAPMVCLAQESLTQKKSVSLLIGARTSSELYPEKLLPRGIKVEIITEDGSAGEKGLVTDFIPAHLSKADQIFACGPVAMYRAMAEALSGKVKNVQISLEVRMGCGIGTCYGCSVKTKQGMKQVCQDGPVFDLDEIIWQEILV